MTVLDVESLSAGDVVSNGAAWWVVREVRDPRHGLAAAHGGLSVVVSHYANPAVTVTFTEIPGLPSRLRLVRRHTGFVCKSCGAESPAGIGYARQGSAYAPWPDPDCAGPHVD